MKDLDNYLEPKEVQQIMSHIDNDRDYLLITLLWKTGMRVSDALNLHKESIDFDNRAINIKYSKGGKSRRVPIDLDTLRLLRSYCSQKNLDSDDKLFPMTRQNAFRLIKHYGEKAGFRKVHPHTFRHSFAVNCLRHGADIRSLQVWLGHANLNTTAEYLQFKDETMREAYDKVKF